MSGNSNILVDIDSVDDIKNLSDNQLWDLFDSINLENSNETETETDTVGNSSSRSNTDSDSVEIGCPNCGQTNAIVKDMTQGIMVCTDCGAVCNELLDHNPVWKSYGDEASYGRCGAATDFFLPKSSLGTTIAGSKYNRLKRLHSWSSMPYRERSLYDVLTNINAKCQKNGIKKNIVDDAKLMYKKISECKHLEGENKGKFIIIRGSNRRSLIASCVFYACKIRGDTRSPKEIANIFDLKMTDITKGCKKFLQLMKLHYEGYKLDSSMPEHFVERFCKLLKIHKKYTEIAIKIAENIRKLGLASDHTPPSVAAGSILLMSKMNKLALTKKIIGKKFGISEVTISKIYRKIEKYKVLLIDSEETDKVVKLMESN